MSTDFISDRIIQLRQKIDVSAREMSLAIGMAPNFIHTLENKKALPSLESFIYICDYFRISPRDFFDEGNNNPSKINALIKELKCLDDDALVLVTSLVQRLNGSHSSTNN